jgi:hypothetical protein
VSLRASITMGHCQGKYTRKGSWALCWGVGRIVNSLMKVAEKSYLELCRDLELGTFFINTLGFRGGRDRQGRKDKDKLKGLMIPGLSLLFSEGET